MTNMKFEELEVLLEPRVDLYDLAANEFDFRENFVERDKLEIGGLWLILSIIMVKVHCLMSL